MRKTNPNGTTVSFTYDGLNRAKTKVLSMGSWTYLYDTGTNFKGRMVKETLDGSTPGDGNYNDGYDAMGPVTSSHQVTTVNGAAQTYNVSYKYDLAGNLTSQTYPSGKEYRTNFDNAGRVAGASRYISGALDKTYVSNMSYGAQGAVTAMKLGNLKWEHAVYNGRLQPVEMGLGTNSGDSSLFKLEYTFGVRVGGVLDPTKNNGNVESQKITAPLSAGGSTTLTQSYQYDELNRLLSASEGANWSQNYAYDRYGNRAVSSGYILPENQGLTPRTVGSPGDDINPATNRIVACVYDTSGNVISDQLGRGFTYDSENHQLSFNGTAGQYRYDCDGRRVLKTDATGAVVFVYNAGGQLLAEYTTGQVQNNGTSYFTTDHLGSTRVVTDVNGGVRSRHDYLPFGEEIPSTVGRSNVANYGVTDGVRQKFTQKQRDTESGLDYFEARYYSSAQGRFTSPDEFTGGPDDLFDFADAASDNPTFYGELHEPQSLNKYQYCYGNPLRYVDPNGHGLWDKLKSAANTAAQIAKDTVVGAAKELYNSAVAYPANAVNSILDANLALVGSKFRFGQAPTAQMSTPGEQSAANATDVVLIYEAATSIAARGAAAPVSAGRSAETTAAADVAEAPKGMRNPEVARTVEQGQAEHAALAQKVKAKAKAGWKSEPRLKDPLTGKTVKPDVVTPRASFRIQAQHTIGYGEGKETSQSSREGYGKAGSCDSL